MFCAHGESILILQNILSQLLAKYTECIQPFIDILSAKFISQVKSTNFCPAKNLYRTLNGSSTEYSATKLLVVSLVRTKVHVSLFH